MASGYAFLVQCAGRGHADIEPIERLGRLYQEAMTEATYREWRDVYQRTLHEKRMYSIAKDLWLPYTISRDDCRDANRATEFFLRRLSSPSRSDRD